jgi:hypothetical protein
VNVTKPFTAEELVRLFIGTTATGRVVEGGELSSLFGFVLRTLFDLAKEPLNEHTLESTCIRGSFNSRVLIFFPFSFDSRIYSQFSSSH